MNSKTLELLINKYLDSEITPAEKRLLDNELRINPEAHLMLEDLHRLRDLARTALTNELESQTASSAAIIQQAFQKSSNRKIHPFTIRGWLHNITALAAGFLLGLATYGVISHWVAEPPDVMDASPNPTITVDNQSLQGRPNQTADSPPLPQHFYDPRWSNPPSRYYQDPCGQPGLIKPPQDDNLENASYHGDL